MTKALFALTLVVLALVLSLPAFAGLVLDGPSDDGPDGQQVPALSPVTWTCSDAFGQGRSPKGPSPGAACGSILSWTESSTDGANPRVTTYSFAGCTIANDPNYARCNYTSRTVTSYPTASPPRDPTVTTSGGYTTAEKSEVLICPANAGDAGGVCKCTAGNTPALDGQSCSPRCKASKQVKSGFFDVGAESGGAPLLIGCADGCMAGFDGVSPAGSAMVGGVKHWFAKGTYTTSGGKCSADKIASSSVGEALATKPEDTCKPGQGSLSMNGKTVCVDQGSGQVASDSKDKSTSTTEKSTKTNDDGSSTTTEKTTKTGSDGTVTTTTTRTTTKPDGSQTSETETTGGTSSGTGERDDSQKTECEKNPSGRGCGGDPATIGDLYTKKDKTLDGVLASGRDSFMSSPVGSAVGGFFVVSGGGSCPTWSAPIAYFKTTLTIDQFCTSFAASALSVFKVALILVASFFAFRIAVE